MLALDRRNWAKGWTEANSHSYWLKEAQVELCMDKPGPGYWSDINAGKPAYLTSLADAGAGQAQLGEGLD